MGCCRWEFSKKLQPNGMVEQYNARLVVKGYTRTYGVDTFAPIAKINFIYILIFVASNQGWSLL